MGELTAEVCSMQKSWCPQYPGLNVQELLTSMDVEEGRKEKLGAPSARDMLKVIFQYDSVIQIFFFCTILASFVPRVQKRFVGIFIIFVAKPVEIFVGSSCILCFKPGFEGSCTF